MGSKTRITKDIFYKIFYGYAELVIVCFLYCNGKIVGSTELSTSEKHGQQELGQLFGTESRGTPGYHKVPRDRDY